MSAGGPKPSSFYIERQATTRTPATPALPSGLDSAHAAGQADSGFGNPYTPGDGLILANVFSIVVSIYANTGQTLSGAGTLKCWIFNTYQQVWTRCDDLDFDCSTTSGFTAKTFPTLRNASRLGMLINFLTSGVTTSGIDILVRIDAFTSVDGQGAS